MTSIANLEDVIDDFLPTFPSDADIQHINQALESGKYYIIVSRMSSYELDVIIRIRDKYYSQAPRGDFVQKFFPFEEGITLEDLTGRINKSKVIHEHPIMVTRAAKSRMSHKQLIAELTDPNSRFPAPELDLQLFIKLNDAEGWRWCYNMANALNEEKKK
jgi:hypothetical protein